MCKTLKKAPPKKNSTFVAPTAAECLSGGSWSLLIRLDRLQSKACPRFLSGSGATGLFVPGGWRRTHMPSTHSPTCSQTDLPLKRPRSLCHRESDLSSPRGDFPVHWEGCALRPPLLVDGLPVGNSATGGTVSSDRDHQGR